MTSFYTVLVDPYGLSTRAGFSQIGREVILCTSIVKIEKIAGLSYIVFSKQSQRVVKWPADLYNQTNPQLTTKTAVSPF